MPSRTFHVTVETRQSGTLSVQADNLEHAHAVAIRRVQQLGLEKASGGCVDDPDHFVTLAMEFPSQ